MTFMNSMFTDKNKVKTKYSSKEQKNKNSIALK